MITPTNNGHFAFTFRGQYQGRLTLWDAKGNDMFRLYNVEILPQYQSHGHGQLLIRNMITWVKRNAPWCKFIWLSVTNPIAKHIYEKYGFRAVRNNEPFPGRYEMILILTDLEDLK